MQPPSSSQPNHHRRGQRLLFVAGVFGVLLTFPLLGLADQPRWLLGVPVLYLYLFGGWLLLIGLTAWLVRK